LVHEIELVPEFMPESGARKIGIGRSYDVIAAEYARRIFDELKDKPFDRELLDQFALQAGNSGLVCDLGCGPGHIARYLRDRGTRAFGVDLPAGMLEQARARNPDIPFVQGSMLAMGLRSESLAAVAAFYSIIHPARTSGFRLARDESCAPARRPASAGFPPWNLGAA
jgi:SAM-dependent methyltransferase